MNITFAKIEDNTGMYGENQIGVYIDGLLRFFITESEFAAPIRVFSCPENLQMCDFLDGKIVKTTKEMKRVIMDDIASLLDAEKGEQTFFIKPIFTNGLFGSVSKDHLEYGRLNITNYSCTGSKFSAQLVDAFKEQIKNHANEIENVSSIEIINTRNFSSEVIYTK